MKGMCARDMVVWAGVGVGRDATKAVVEVFGFPENRQTLN